MIGAVGAMLLFLRHCSGTSVVVHSDTVTLVRVDTVVVEKPVPLRVVEREPVYIRVPVPGDTIFEPGDTVFVPVPIQQYQFRDSLYVLDVSGYAVSVDRLELYPRTICRTINTTVERVVKDKRHWALTVGPGVGYGPHGVLPYVGISFGFVLWSR